MNELHSGAMEYWGDTPGFLLPPLCCEFTCLLFVKWEVLNFRNWGSPFNLRWLHSHVAQAPSELSSSLGFWHFAFPKALRSGLCHYPQIRAIQCSELLCKLTVLTGPAGWAGSSPPPAPLIWSFGSKCIPSMTQVVHPEGAKQAPPPGL